MLSIIHTHTIIVPRIFFFTWHTDWYHDQSSDLLDSFLNQYNPTGAEPVPQSGLIKRTPNPSFNFVPGKTYRLRLINMSGFSMFYVSIDGHDLDVIEIDGVSNIY